MVDATISGILFTANPLTGKRHQAVIDASHGLGEAIVSGVVNPDHFVINTPTGEIVERRIGDKRVAIQTMSGGGTQRIEHATQIDEACLTDEQIRALADLGAKVEAHYDVPQDIEWAINASNHIWLTQARPITTLYPLPATAPSTDEILRVYFSFNVVQGRGVSTTHTNGDLLFPSHGLGNCNSTWYATWRSPDRSERVLVDAASARFY